ncbi:MAG: polymerase sigma-70 factor, family, partial [Pseudonocardiales bacterium]|nr:polymerase sigma-70 factor, family [Pseudonocardiales bacterium]
MSQPAEVQPDRTDFMRDADRFRRELLAHCYRMLGSVDDAEDLVQETYLRAWRAYDSFEGRSSVRTWLYRIATNACLTALQHSGHRVLPSGLGAPGDDPDADLVPAPVDTAWLQPFPDSVLRRSDDPAEIVASRSSLRLALIASLQYLPARQRAVLILRDVLAFPATEVAVILGMSVPGVKSALQRARARLDDVAATPDDIVEPDSPEARAILDGYIAAFENADAQTLQNLLRSDASLQMTPTSTWFSGKRTCAPFLARHVLRTPGEYRMFPTIANGQPAAVAYRRNPDDVMAFFAIAVLSTDEVHITGITVFADPVLARRFGYVDVLPAEHAAATGERRPTV